MKYKKLTAIILKKQNYREADQIVTVWSREAGKVRFLAKGLRKSSSKLNYACDSLAELEIDLAGSSQLPILIGVKPLQQFGGLIEDLKKSAIAFYASELMIKMTADEHANMIVYDMLIGFLKTLNADSKLKDYDLLDEFSLNLARELGFGTPAKTATHRDVKEFMEYILERSIKSEAFLWTT